jgi:hypothetical protein
MTSNIGTKPIPKSAASSADGPNTVTLPAGKVNFADPAQRPAHITAFLAWLPLDLYNVPGIDWESLPSAVMYYLIHTVADSPDAEAMALAMGASALGARELSLYQKCKESFGLLRRLRNAFGFTHLTELSSAATWEHYVAGRELSPAEVSSLFAFASLAAEAIPTWLEMLDEEDRIRWAARTFPRPPARFHERWNQWIRTGGESRARRKAATDVLVPLFPLLVALAQVRKQAAQRLIERFRSERQRVEQGKVTLPYTFSMQERLYTISENALTLSEVHFIERDVVLSFTIWDRRSWVLAHPELYSANIHNAATRRYRSSSYDPEKEHYFLEFSGDPTDLLWFGDLIAAGRLHKVRDQPNEFVITRSGLLRPPREVCGFLSRARRDGAVLFEPESLYRGVLYGAAIASTALTNACRLSELLQLSMERYVVEMVPEFDDGLRKTGNVAPCLFQHLLPKGAAHDSERQLFLILPNVAALLNEIAIGLEAAHGEVPVVAPDRNAKAEDLRPERYLLQWAASPDGRLGLLEPYDVQHLLRFLFHGLQVFTTQGEPINVALHLLRHIAATHARQAKRVPAEIVAHHMLHHKLVRAEGAAARQYVTSALTDYYTRLPEQDRLGLFYTLQTRYNIGASDILVMPDTNDLVAMEQHLRSVFERWGAIAPVTFGWCGAPGLCIRPDNRGHCLGCGYLQPDWRRFANIAPYREIYQRMLSRAEEQGLHTETKQMGQHLAALDGLAAVMQTQYIAWKDRQEGTVVDRILGVGTEGVQHVPVGIDG